MTTIMNETYLRNVLEAALHAAGKPLTINDLGALFDDVSRPPDAQLHMLLGQLADSYAERSLELIETAAGWRVQVRREYAHEVARLWPERPQRYSRALLETLALIAYRQPITRAEIEAVRGVAVNPNILKTLQERNWVRVVGHRDLPGRPELLGTTRDFLDYFSLKSLEDLPPLAALQSLGESDPQMELSEAGALASLATELEEAPLAQAAETAPTHDEEPEPMAVDVVAANDDEQPAQPEEDDAPSGQAGG